MVLSRLIDRTARAVVFCVLLSAGADLEFCAHVHEPIGPSACVHLEWRADAAPSHQHSKALNAGSCFCHGYAVPGPSTASASPFVIVSGLDRDPGASPLAATPALVDHPPPSRA